MAVDERTEIHGLIFLVKFLKHYNMYGLEHSELHGPIKTNSQCDNI